MDILDVVRADLKGATVKRQREVAAICGIAWSTLRRIVDGSGCQHRTAEKLRGYYARQIQSSAPIEQQAAWHGRDIRKQQSA